MRRKSWAIVAALVCLAATGSAALALTRRHAAPLPPPAPSCTWGASSITATRENGRLVVSKPQTSGCVSRP